MSDWQKDYPAFAGCLLAALTTAATGVLAAGVAVLYVGDVIPWWGVYGLAGPVVFGGSQLAGWMAR